MKLCCRALAVLFVATVLPACANRVPPRPVPPDQAKEELPGWWPEERWDRRTSEERTFFYGKVVFDTAKHSIRPESEAVLQQLLTYLQQNPDISRIRLEGHTDARAGEEYNQSLSERRAIAVADWLVDHGLDHNRLLAVAFGEQRPRATNDTAAGRQENRRTEFHVAEVSGRRFRGNEPTNGGYVITVLSKEEREAFAKKGEVPVYEPPPTVVEKDIFKPYPPPGQEEKPLDKQILGDEDADKSVDAATGEVIIEKNEE